MDWTYLAQERAEIYDKGSSRLGSVCSHVSCTSGQEKAVSTKCPHYLLLSPSDSAPFKFLPLFSLHSLVL